MHSDWRSNRLALAPLISGLLDWHDTHDVELPIFCSVVFTRLSGGPLSLDAASVRDLVQLSALIADRVGVIRSYM